MNTSELFSKAVSVEDRDPATALQMYEQVIAEDKDHAAAYINAGTIYYNKSRYPEAERYYRRAIEIDPNYQLAYFDLGNVLDETGRILDAIASYRHALKLNPKYADCHYNLALVYEKNREPRKALKHWQAYRKLDGSTAWGKHAKGQIDKIVAASGLKLAWVNPRKPRRTKRRAKLA